LLGDELPARTSSGVQITTSKGDNTLLRLLLARHGETIWNAQHRYQGQTDVPLNEMGKQQAEALGRRLAGEQIDVIYASDLGRAWETAQAIAKPHKLDVQPEPRLREMDFGEWEGLTFAEIERNYPDELSAWLEDPQRAAPAGGEPGTHFSARVRAVLDALVVAHQGQTVIVAAHGGSLRALLCLALGLSPGAQWRFRLGQASLSELFVYEEVTVLALLNDRCHLSRLLNHTRIG